ncbi:unnamed protein product [Polarella glacialis]|uniref:Uncharacterized protein n=1 Tax=Polarella glacialis TaxID=89957 RepID=A0A813KPC9_POLGL|nr:unnamed protein product [Polarella glacialis]
MPSGPPSTCRRGLGCCWLRGCCCVARPKVRSWTTARARWLLARCYLWRPRHWIAMCQPPMLAAAARHAGRSSLGSAPTGGRLPASSEAWGSHDFLLSGSLAARRPASDAFEPVEPMPASSSELLVTAVVERAAAAALSRGGGLGLESEPWAWTLGS